MYATCNIANVCRHMTYKYSKGNATVVLQVREPGDNGTVYEGQLVQTLRVVRHFLSIEAS